MRILRLKKYEAPARIVVLCLLLLAVTHSALAQSTAYIGKVLGTDGKMYKTVAAATNAGTTASGIIAYWGAAGSVESGNSSYRGMAIALEDAVLRWGEWPDHTNYCSSDNHQCSTATAYCSTVSSALNAINGIAATESAQSNNGSGHWHNGPCNGYKVDRPSGASMWAIPSVGQWKLMAQELTGKSSNLSDADNPDYTYNKLSAKITAAGGNTLQWLLYWSSTEKDASKTWTFDLGGINSDRNGSRFNAIAKNHDNQYMHVRMFFAFSSATAAVYTISYNANGGSGAPSNQAKDGGVNLTLSSTVPTRSGYAFTGWNTKADGSGTSYASGATYTGNADATLYAQWYFQGSGSSNDPYLIPSAELWNYLADNVSAGNTYSGKHFRQTGDFTITRMMGSALHADGGNQDEVFHTFNGTYDGYGHTLTANLNVTGERYAAPFHCIADGATIKNLIVTGYVTVSGGSTVEATRHPAGLVGTTRSGSCVIQNCRVSADVSGADYMGGILGHSWYASITIRGCIYNGTLTANGTNYTGGLIGWGGDSGSVTINLTDNLFTGSYSGSGKFHPVGVLCTIAGNTITVTNAYYSANPVGIQGNDGNALVGRGSSAIPTTDKPANLGTPTTVYSVSGITVYSNGLAMSGQYFCGSPDFNYSLTPTPVTIMGESKYVTTFYHGTLDYQLPDGALAYTAEKDGSGVVVFYRIGTDSNVIPHDTAVIIVADASALSEGKIALTKLPSTDVTAKTGNILKGSDTDVTLTEGKVEGKTPYVLGVAGDPAAPGFFPFTGSAIPAGKAYYVVD